MRRILILAIVLLISCGGSKVDVQPFKGAIYNFGKVDDHTYRGTQPFTTDFAGLKKLGVKTILSLRNDDIQHSRQFATEAGLAYKNVPMSSTNTPKVASIQQALDIIRDPENWPVYVHCEGGRHRTGVVIAVYRVLDSGWDKKKAWDEAYKYDFYRSWGHGPIEDWFLVTFDPMRFTK